MNNLLQLFLLKMADTMINSGKTIFMIRGQKFLSASSQAISNVFYIILMSKLMKSTDPASIAVTSMAMFFGQYLSQWVAEKFDKEKIFKVNITAPTKEVGKEIADSFRENNIPVQTFSCFVEEGKLKSLGMNVFTETKQQSAIVSAILEQYEGVKFNITTIKNRF